MENQQRDENKPTFGQAVANLKKDANGKWAAIFYDLVPEMREALANAPMHVPCPAHGGFDGFRLFEHFNDTGRCVCNTCGPKNSGFDTLMWVKGCNLVEAFKLVNEWMHKEGTEPQKIRELSTYVPKPRLDPQIAMESIRRVWSQTSMLAGTAAERYLLNRGIWRQNMPKNLRFHPGLPYRDLRTKQVLGVYPCLIAPIMDKDGKVISLHRIFITEEGMKAPVPDPKRMMALGGDIKGGAIRLYQPTKILGVAEGIETALAAHAISRMPTWATVTSTLMQQLSVPEHVETVVIWTDLDRNQAGINAANALAALLETQGKKVEICLPPGEVPDDAKGVDWLDVMNERGLNGFPPRWRRWRDEMLVRT